MTWRLEEHVFLRYPVVILAALAGCGAEEGKDEDGLEIVGDYVDEFGTTHLIDEGTWTMDFPEFEPGHFHVSQWDNEGQFLIAQNDSSNAYNPDEWSRFDWSTGANGHLYFCQTRFDAPDEDGALNTGRADDSDPAAGGCGGFSWTDLTP